MMDTKIESEFTSKVVIITGGSGGIGKEIAKKFLAEGAIVYIVGRDITTLQLAKKELININHTVDTINFDISVPDNCRKTIEIVFEKEGRLDFLINSAGTYVEAPIDEIELKDFNTVINTNLRGTYFMCKYVKPFLEKTNGCIVNIGSTAGITGFDENSLYCASKGGVNLLTKSLAIEYAKYGIRVNIVNPDMVKTKMLDIGFRRSGIEERSTYDNMQLQNYPNSTTVGSRFILPEEIAESVIFLASKEKAGAITGAGITVDFGLTTGIF